MSPHPSSQPDTEERQELGLRLRLRLREGPGSRESRCAAWTRLHRSCSARHLSQRSKAIATTSSGKSFRRICGPPISTGSSTYIHISSTELLMKRRPAPGSIAICCRLSDSEADEPVNGGGNVSIKLSGKSS